MNATILNACQDSHDQRNICFAFETFEFNRTINYQGESLWLIKLKEKKPGIITAKVYQDLYSDFKITKKDLIFKGIIKAAIFPDDLTNFFGTIKLKKIDA